MRTVQLHVRTVFRVRRATLTSGVTVLVTIGLLDDKCTKLRAAVPACRPRTGVIAVYPAMTAKSRLPAG